MATQEEVAARREENNRLREQIELVKRKQADDLAAADQDIRMQRADREHESLEAELAALMGQKVDPVLTAPPEPETTTVVAAPAVVETAPAPKPAPAAPKP